MPRIPRHPVRPLTLSEWFLSRTNLPSRSTSSILMPPVAEARWPRRKLPVLPLLLPEPMPLEEEPPPGLSSGSSRRRLPRPGRPGVDTLLVPPLEVARETVTLEDGLGDSFSLGAARGGRHGRPQSWGPGLPPTPPRTAPPRPPAASGRR